MPNGIRRGYMIALKLTSLKIFMAHFLTRDTFDNFLLEEANIGTAATYSIDGHINRDFYPPEERTEDMLPYDLLCWSEIKGLCFDLIKGKHTPLYFKFVLHLKPETVADLLQKWQCPQLLSQLKSLVLTIRFDQTGATLTTGIAYHTFIPTKEADQAWDKEIPAFLSEKGIPFEPMQ